MKRERIMGGIGVILWIFIHNFRFDILLNNILGRSLINVLPNFAVVWVLYYFIVGMSYHINKKQLPKAFGRTCILAVILLTLIILEFNSSFFLEGVDYWDMVASGVAVVLVIIITAIRKDKPKVTS